MEKTVKVLEDHKNLIQSAAGSIASMGLDHVGKRVGGVLVTPAVWALNHSATGAQPDKTDVGIYATGFMSVGASVAVGLLKAHVDDDMNKKLSEIQKKENAKWSPYIKNCYHFSSSAPAISAQIIASNGGTAWKHPNGLLPHRYMAALTMKNQMTLTWCVNISRSWIMPTASWQCRWTNAINLSLRG